MATRAIPVLLPNAKVRVHIEANVQDGPASEDGADVRISGNPFSFLGISTAITAIATEFEATLLKIGPKKSTVKFGVEVGVEAGQLTALIVKGSGKANLEVTLEWER